jgi:uncharacterized protein YprB with RNaseH-like and TPR domain
MDPLSERLKALGVKVGAQDIIPQTRRYPIDEVFPGDYQATQFGDAYYVDEFYGPDITHGDVVLGLPSTIQMISEWAGLSSDHLDKPESFVFLDTETSGLAGGAGTFAFMVGVGRFEQEKFRLRQYFLRDPSEEPALLAGLEEFLALAETVVTFNGKAFDLPLLEGRYIRNGSRLSWKPSGHIDLLHLARRIWRDRLPSRALSQLEIQILGVTRTEEEVPGWLVPQMYIDYLQTGDARPMQGVFYHNAIDVLSMVALLNHTSELLEEPLITSPEDGIQLVAIGKLCEDLGRTEQAISLYQHGLAQNLPDEITQRTQKRLSLIWKRGENYGEAIALWERAAENEEIYAFVELAKYYEHRAKDLDQAAGWTQEALELLLEEGFPPIERFTWQSALEHRMQRLNRRLGL